MTVLLLAACQASTGPSAGAPSVAAVVSPLPSQTAAATPTARPTRTTAPTSIPRPTDLPTDGACEGGHPCLGLLAPGQYHTELFEPGFAFTMAAGHWENLAMTPGSVGLLSLDAPGDAIFFFAHPKAVKPDGSLDLSVEMTVAGITDWFTTNEALTTGPATDVSIGGLRGKRMDIALAPGAVAPAGDCPTQTCLGFFIGRSNTWEWDWGTASSERQRMYVLEGKDGVVLIFVDSLDGTTFDSLTKAADTILATVKFDQ